MLTYAAAQAIAVVDSTAYKDRFIGLTGTEALELQAKEKKEVRAHTRARTHTHTRARAHTHTHTTPPPPHTHTTSPSPSVHQVLVCVWQCQQCRVCVPCCEKEADMCVVCVRRETRVVCVQHDEMKARMSKAGLHTLLSLSLTDSEKLLHVPPEKAQCTMGFHTARAQHRNMSNLNAGKLAREPTQQVLTLRALLVRNSLYLLC